MPATPPQANSEAALAAVAAIVSAKHPVRPGCGTVPVPLRRLLPDPLHESGWAMLTHDLSGLTRAQRSARAWRLRVAIVLCPDPADVPVWAVDHLAALEVA